MFQKYNLGKEKKSKRIIRVFLEFFFEVSQDKMAWKKGTITNSKFLFSCRRKKDL